MHRLKVFEKMTFCLNKSDFIYS